MSSSREPEVLAFTKMHGAGNDYIYVDATRDVQQLDRLVPHIESLSKRHFGVGSDGLIAITRGDAAPVRMHMWNADSSRGALCVNGLRCAAWFARDCGAVSEDRFEVETDVGTHACELSPASAEKPSVRVRVGGLTVDDEFDTYTDPDGRPWRFVGGSAGNPHAVVFVDEDPDQLEIEAVGRAIQQLPRFEDSANVEFIQVRGENTIVQRTYERGSGETLACGSGAIAAACASLVHGFVSGPNVEVVLRGGTLIITDHGHGQFELEGPVAIAFRGEVQMP